MRIHLGRTFAPSLVRARIDLLVRRLAVTGRLRGRRRDRARARAVSEVLCVLGLLVPHHKSILFVHLDCPLIQVWVFCFQLSQKIYTELFSPFSSFFPNCVEVTAVAKVLSYCYGEVQVQHTVPPAAWNEHGFTWMLNALNYSVKFPTASWSFFLLQPW